MKLSKLIDPNFQAAVKKLTTQELSVATAIKLRDIMKAGDAELAKYEDARRAKLETFGEKDADGKLTVDDNGNVKMSQDNLKAFVNELNELLDSTVDIGCLTATELGDKVKLSVIELMTLGDIISG